MGEGLKYVCSVEKFCHLDNLSNFLYPINNKSAGRESKLMRIYLDNCCYNRPYDDQSQLRISLESQAKLHIQEMIKDNKLQLASSYTLIYENSKNPYEIKRKTIGKFLDNTSIYVDESYEKGHSSFKV